MAPELQVVLQVLADAGQRVDDRRADRLETLRPADAGEFEQLRRADRAGRQHHFALRPRLATPAVLAIAQADRAAPLEQDPLDMRARSTRRRFGRLRIGFRKPVAALQRRPRRWLTSK